jgi:catechol 2,3-dioxygenase-like lactoylglutathione lyase family enzyme
MIFMIELTVCDVEASTRWYCETLGFSRELVDVKRGFVLLKPATGETKLALKEGVSSTTGVILHFATDDLNADITRLGYACEVKTSDEGYRRIKLEDPDGVTVVLFEWIDRLNEHEA